MAVIGLYAPRWRGSP
ncbi:hypothetical protein EIB18_00320 [Caulobacter vibrioides]|nr:hypothetical protein [Caulobacter vibrioides]AVG21585.1 hypothetical protein CA608_20015 [Caulobacter vibrioides]AZH14741.1 hypothetical protein EIB18_00320 [Caulobacter vibrioides]PLR13304.1 hypothetical protein CVUC_07950 [Caulobacter vibrioides]